jgi:protein SCO1
MIANTSVKAIDSSIPARRSIRWSRLFYILIAVFVIIVLAFNIFKPIIVLPRVGLAPGYAFTNQDGATKTSEDFRGKLTIYNFTYTGCGTGCPQTSLQMQALRSALAPIAGQDVKFALVTISIDPEYDTPAALNQYASQFFSGAPSSVSWDFLTGDPTRTKYVVGGGFNVYYQARTNETSAIVFDPRYVLVDGWGVVRAEYRNQDLDQQRILRDIGYLESEIHNSQGAARYAYEAAHLFRCYP